MRDKVKTQRTRQDRMLGNRLTKHLVEVDRQHTRDYREELERKRKQKQMERQAREKRRLEAVKRENQDI
jgi:hypothetical protein